MGFTASPSRVSISLDSATGKLLVTVYDASQKAYVARLNADGTRDNFFAASQPIPKAKNPSGFLADADCSLRVHAEGGVYRIIGTTPGPYGVGFSTLSADGETSSAPVRTDALTPFGFTSCSFQKDGKLVAVGTLGGDYNGQGVIARFNRDGSLDASFGSGGYKVDSSIGTVYSAVAAAPDGKIYIAGRNSTSALFGFYDASGTSFTFDTRQWGGQKPIPATVCPIPGGGAYFAGYVRDGSYDHAFVARYSAPGASLVFDSTYGSSGFAVTDFGVPTAQALAYSVALLPDGRLIAVGRRFDTTYLPAAAVIAADGSSFTQLVLGVPSNTLAAGATRVVVGRDGTVYIAGAHPAASTSTPWVLRLNSSLVPDAAFGIGGLASASAVPSASVNGLSVLPDGTVYIGGLLNTGMTSGDRFFVSRVSPSGVFDSSYGTGGYVMAAPASGMRAYSTAFSPDGRAAGAGSSADLPIVCSLR